MRYLRPTSLTWWAGLMAFATGTAALLLPESGPLADLARLVALLAGTGDAAPITLIFMRAPGIVHTRASRSISDHRAPRTSPDLAPP